MYENKIVKIIIFPINASRKCFAQTQKLDEDWMKKKYVLITGIETFLCQKYFFWKIRLYAKNWDEKYLVNIFSFDGQRPLIFFWNWLRKVFVLISLSKFY